MTRHEPILSMQQMLDHAAEAIDVLGGRSDEMIEQDRIRQLALIRLVEVVGEAATRVTPEVRQRYPHVPWRDATQTRNLLIHGYDAVKTHILCRTIREDFPGLIDHLREALAAENNE